MSNHICRPIFLLMGVLAAAATAQTTQPAATEYHSGGYPETYQGAFYPGAELRALPAARAQAVVAKAELRRAETNLDNTVADARRLFQHSAELKEALAESRKAYDAFQAARGIALAELKRDTTYQAVIELRTRLAEQIEEANGQKGITHEQLMAMAQMKLSYSTKASTMEAAALAADSRVKDARDRLVSAGNRLSDLTEQFDDSVHNSQIILAARQAVQEARIAALGTDALYVEAANVANAAMDYAYHLYDHPQPYVVNSPYYGGYGYPVSVGYRVGYPYSWSSSAR